MKKTLITLAALAAASVAQAATLDFTQETVPTSVTFAGDSSDAIILAGATTLTDTVMSYDGKNVTVNGPLFHGHENNSAITNGKLSGATIDFGATGSLTVTQSKNMNLYNQALTFKGLLDNVVLTTDDKALAGTYTYYSRTIVSASTADWGIWNYDNTASVTYTFTSDDATMSYLGTEKSDEDLMKAGLGAYTVKRVNDGGDLIVRYLVRYNATPAAPAVPEPTTATLSLLALAGLAARRRRK